MNNYDNYIASLFSFIDSAWDCVNFEAFASYVAKVAESDVVDVRVCGTRHPSTRAKRRKATAHHKKADARKATALGMNSPWKEPTRSKWVDPYLKHHVSAGDWRLALKGKATSKARRAEDKGVIREYLNEDTYGVFIDEDWEQAWKEHDEAEYWEAIEASEYEDMRTFEEVRAYYDD